MNDRHAHDEEHDRGLAHDLQVLLRERRRALKFLAGASLLPLVGCSSGAMDGLDAGAMTGPDAATTADTGTTTPATCATLPEETAGPYPGDGSNGANALALTGIVRSDIRPSLAPLSGTAEGIPLTIKLTLVNTRAACAPLAGHAIYLWHCDRDAAYSMYTTTTQNYLRGVQATDANGAVTFTSIFPACYAGRWPHIHFEMYPTLASTTSSGNKIKTSQLALPQDVCSAVYATTGYAQSVRNLSGITLASDNVFSDGSGLQMATVAGDLTAGYVATLTVGIAV